MGVPRRSSNPGATPKRLVREVRQVRRGRLGRDLRHSLEDRRGPVAEHRTRRELSAQELEVIVARFRAGVTMKVIAAELEIDRRRVRKVLYEAGAAQPRTRLTNAQVAQAARLYEDGASLARVGDRFGVSAGTIRSKLLDAGVVIRPGVGGPVSRSQRTA